MLYNNNNNNVLLHDNSKRNRSKNMKLEYIVVYENSSDKFDIVGSRSRSLYAFKSFPLYHNTESDSQVL